MISRHLLSFFLMMSFLVIFVTTSSAETTPAKKLIRGVVNIATAPLEVPKQTWVYWKEGAKRTDHILVWIFSGMVKGIIETTKRVGSGTWDVLTFPWAVPDHYESLIKPEFVFE